MTAQREIQSDLEMATTRVSLAELARVFTKLGTFGFGGPAVHIALLEQEVVQRRKWLTHAAFLDLLGATNLIPGPNSTEMAIHIGLLCGGWRGLLVAGSCFIFPAFLITLVCAWFYVSFAGVPQVQGLLYGVKPVVLAIVTQALWRLSVQTFSKPLMCAIALLVGAASVFGVHELLFLLAAGIAVPLASGITDRFCKGPPTTTLVALPMLPLVAAGTSASLPAGGVGLWSILGIFLKVGSVLYGSGYVLIAFLKADLVDRWGWLSPNQLLDAVAVGQITPGPLFTTATFIGYLLAGWPGACIATLGIFLPAFVFVALSAPWISRLRASPVAGLFLDGVNAASLALMGVAAFYLARGALVDGTTIFLGTAATVLLLATKVNPMWLVIVGAIAGCLIKL